ncbi:MAG: hypothetical protein CMF77_02550 [Candidatus Marinimicrobia bacterium]|nr:hypothetical protein [Candidatus Neomarinimicrobiota bacterium]
MRLDHALDRSNTTAFHPVTILCLLLLQAAIVYLGVSIHPLLILGIPLAIFLFWWAVSHPEFSLILMTLTGIIKGFLEESVPILALVDYTLLLTGVVWLGATKAVIEGRWKVPHWSRKVLYSFSVFCLLLAFSGFYTPSPLYGWIKIASYCVFGMTLFLVPIVLVKTCRDSVRVLNYYKVLLLIVAFGLAGALLYLFLQGGLKTYLIRVSVLGANPIPISRNLAILASMLIVLVLRQGGLSQLSWIPLLLITLLGLVSTGSRGPLLSLFLGVVVYTVFFEPQRRLKLLLYSLLAFGVVLVLLLLLPESLTMRYLQVLEGDVVVVTGGVKRMSTIAMRLEFWQMSIASFLADIRHMLFGIGSGGFSSLFIWRDFKWYPHNMFMEVTAELGLFGLISYFTFLLLAARTILNSRPHQGFSIQTSLWLVALLVMFFAAQFSGDLNNNRGFLLLLAMAMTSAKADEASAENRFSNTGPRVRA